jgi:predicted metal-dependent hydrolase
MRSGAELPRLRRGGGPHREAVGRARRLIAERVPEMNRIYGHAHGKVSIRSQKRRWGSCSTKGTLSFNYRLIYLPAELADYVIAHELCHLKEMNHSPRFWALVAQAFPDWKAKRTELNKYRF